MIVRSKTPLLYDALESKKGRIRPDVISISKNLRTGDYDITVHDSLEIERVNGLPGEEKYSYILLRTRTKTYSPQSINSLFKLFGEIINPVDLDFDSKFSSVLLPALHYISNTTSIYGSVPVTPEEFQQGMGDFELVPIEIIPEP